MLLTLIAAVPVLMSHTFWVGLVVPFCCGWKVSVEGAVVSESVAATPVPETGTVCVPAALVKVRVALRVPVAEGANANWTWQVRPGATITPLQPWKLSWKSPAFVPVNATLDASNGMLPTFSRVAVYGLGLFVPTACVPNVRLSGVTMAAPAVASPMPDKVTVWGLLVAKDTITTVPALAPVVVGTNCTVTLQTLAARRFWTQPVLTMR